MKNNNQTYRNSNSNRSAQSVTPLTSTLGVSNAVGGSTSKLSQPLEFIILIRSPKGTLHALLNPRAGEGALATFEDIEQAIAAQQSNPACLKNLSYIIPVGG